MIWWTRSWNPIIGCSPCSPACANCYAERLHTQRHKALLAGRRMPECYRQPFGTVRFLPERLSQPLHWRKPQRVFVGSMTDLFHQDVQDDWLDRIFAVMGDCPQHTFMVLTKRPERMRDFVLNGKEIHCFPMPKPNVWLGTTIWDQPSADRAVPILLSTPAAKRFVSVEPLLGPVKLTCVKWARINVNPKDYERNGVPAPDELWSTRDAFYSRPADELNSATPGLDWVICGGETGPKARPMHPDWPRRLRDDCVAAGVPFFFKQWGEYRPAGESWKVDFAYGSNDQADIAWPNGTIAWGKSSDHGGLGTPLNRIGSRRAGRVLDGQTWEEVPAC